MYFIRSLPKDSKLTHQVLKDWSSTKKLVFAAILAALSAIIQSAGGLLPVIGLAISPFSTMTILLVTMISLRYGLFSYLLTIILLILIEPSELFIFPFTTGLLGLGIGWGLYTLNQRITVILTNCILLFIGICIPLYGIGFPLLGPAISSDLEISSLLLILGFTFLYSWVWLELGLYFLRRINRFLISEG